MPKFMSTISSCITKVKRHKWVWKSLEIWKRKKIKIYQIQQRSLAPTTGSVIAFLRRPPIERSTNKIFINTSNGGFSVNQNPPSQKPFWVHWTRTEKKRNKPKNKTPEAKHENPFLKTSSNERWNDRRRRRRSHETSDDYRAAGH